jgi:hypothetical protein
MKGYYYEQSCSRVLVYIGRWKDVIVINLVVERWYILVDERILLWAWVGYALCVVCIDPSSLAINQAREGYWPSMIKCMQSVASPILAHKSYRAVSLSIDYVQYATNGLSKLWGLRNLCLHVKNRAADNYIARMTIWVWKTKDFFLHPLEVVRKVME